MEPFALELAASLSGHHDRVWSLAWSPQGDMLASCSADKTVRIWQRRRGGATAAGAGAGAKHGNIHADPTSAHPSSSPAGAGADSAQQWYCCAILDQCHTRTIRSVAWSPGGRALATASFDATVAVWELSGGIWEQVAELEGHENEVKCVAWNPDGRLIATCGRDRSVWIWESMPGREFECVDVKQGHSQDVKVVRWHPSGELLVSAGYDDSIKLWNYDGDEWGCSQTLGGSGHGSGHTSTVWDVAWDPAGQRLASCSDDLTVRIWESRAATATTVAAAAAPGADGADATADAAVTSFSPSRPDLRCATTLSGFHPRTVFSLDWGPSGLIATGDADDSIFVFGQGDPELARVVLQRAEADAEAGARDREAGAAPAGPGPQGEQELGLGVGEAGEAATAAPMDADADADAGGDVGRGSQGAAQEGGGGLQLSQPGGAWGLWAAVRGAHSADVNCVRWNPAQPRLLASCSDDGLIRLWWLR